MDFIRTKEFQSISLSNYWILRNTIFQTFDQQRCQKVLLKTSFTIWTILIMSCNQKKKKKKYDTARSYVFSKEILYPPNYYTIFDISYIKIIT